MRKGTERLVAASALAVSLTAMSGLLIAASLFVRASRDLPWWLICAGAGVCIVVAAGASAVLVEEDTTSTSARR